MVAVKMIYFSQWPVRRSAERFNFGCCERLTSCHGRRATFVPPKPAWTKAGKIKISVSAWWCTVAFIRWIAFMISREFTGKKCLMAGDVFPTLNLAPRCGPGHNSCVLQLMFEKDIWATFRWDIISRNGEQNVRCHCFLHFHLPTFEVVLPYRAISIR